MFTVEQVFTSENFGIIVNFLHEPVFKFAANVEYVSSIIQFSPILIDLDALIRKGVLDSATRAKLNGHLSE